MADGFDPYYKWLGIPPKDQPPHHYRLLGVELFESDAEVIEAAADRHVAYLQDVAAGPHVRQAQRLLNEIAVARLCLLDERKKGAYDEKLKAQLGSGPAAPAAPPAAAPPPVPDKLDVSDDGPRVATEPPLPPVSTAIAGDGRQAARRLRSVSSIWLIAGACCLALALGGLIVGICLLPPAADEPPGEPRAAQTPEREDSPATPLAETEAEPLRELTAPAETPGGIESPAWNPADLADSSDTRPQLVAHYTFDNPQRPGADAAGTYADAFPGATIEFDAELNSRVLVLDGVNNRFDIPRPVHSDFTIALWVRTGQQSENKSVWHMGPGIVDGDVAGPAEDYGLSLMKGMPAFGVGSRGTTVKSERQINDDDWHHVAVTRDADTGQVRLFVDGRLENERAAPTGRKDAASRLTVGCTQSKPQFFQGRLDDIRFYNYVLSDEEIRDLAGGRSP